MKCEKCGVEVEFLEELGDWEYLNGFGEWKEDKYYTENYSDELKKLNYIFDGNYDYFISNPESSKYQLIWRKKK